jgi:hypothetical protein
MDEPKMAQFDRSPDDGLALSFADAHDTSPEMSLAVMQAQIASWKRSTAKQIWPWVDLNRIIGANDAEGNPHSNVPYFQRFQGLDLDGKAGAQSNFLENRRNALRIAKATGVPGIACDLEFYNIDKPYDLCELARMTSKPPEMLHALRQLGARRAELAAAEYPGAMIGFLFTGFGRPNYRVIQRDLYNLAATYMVEGLRDQAQQHHFSFRVLSGGVVGLGDCHNSADDFRHAIEQRAAAFAPPLQKYNRILEPAGTMTLRSDRSATKNGADQGACGTSSAATVEDLIPYIWNSCFAVTARTGFMVRRIADLSPSNP